MWNLSSLGRFLCILLIAVIVAMATGHGNAGAAEQKAAKTVAPAGDAKASKDASETTGGSAAEAAKFVVKKAGQSMKNVGEKAKEIAIEAKNKAVKVIEKAGEITKKAVQKASKAARETLGATGERIKRATGQ